MKREWKVGEEIEILSEDNKKVSGTILEISEKKDRMKILAHCTDGDVIVTVAREYIQ